MFYKKVEKFSQHETLNASAVGGAGRSPSFKNGILLSHRLHPYLEDAKRSKPGSTFAIVALLSSPDMPTAIRDCSTFDDTSDAIDHGAPTLLVVARSLLTEASIVNVLKGKLCNDKRQSDNVKDNSEFRQYDTACDSVKEFYREQHGLSFSSPLFPSVHGLSY